MKCLDETIYWYDNRSKKKKKKALVLKKKSWWIMQVFEKQWKMWENIYIKILNFANQKEEEII